MEKNHHFHDFNVIKIYLAQKNDNLKFHPAEKKSVVGCHKYSAYNVAIYVLYIKKVNFDGIRCVGFFYNFFNVKYKHPNNNVRC